MSQGTADALHIKSHRLHIIKAESQFEIGAWTILPFKTIHDAAEPLGFLMACGNARMLYVTDTQYISHRFKGLTHILVECNYSMEIVRRLKATGQLDSELWRRIINSHMSLETLVGFLKANDLSHVQEIWLLHLSNNNSDANLFKKTIREITGVPVYISG